MVASTTNLGVDSSRPNETAFSQEKKRRHGISNDIRYFINIVKLNSGAERQRLGDVAVFENRQPVTAAG
jgi:hypothetical protein